MTFAQEPCGPAFGFDRLFDRKRVIGLVGIHFAGLIGNDRGSDVDIRLAGRSDLDLADEARVLVGGDMRLIAMRRGAAFVLHPGGLFVALARRADDGGVN